MRIEHPLKALIIWLAISVVAMFGVGTVAAAETRSPAPTLFKSGDAAIDNAAEKARDSMRADPKSTIALAAQVESMLRNRPHDLTTRIAIAQAQWLQAEASLRVNQPDRAAALIRRALPAISKIKDPFKLRADLLLTRGGVDQVRADVAGALSSYQAAYNIFEALGETRSQAIALQSIASLYRQAGDQKMAMKYDRQSAEVYSGDPGFAVSTHNNQGNALRQLGRPREAEVEYREALAVADRMNSPLLRMRILANIARGQIEAGEADRATATLAQARNLVTSPDTARYAHQLTAIEAEAAYQQGNYARAATLIGQSFKGVDLSQTGIADRDAHLTAYHAYQKVGRLDLALRHLEAMKRIDDATAKLAASTNTALMAARFDFANQDLKIARLRQRELQRNVEFERSRAQFQRIIFVGVTLATLIGVSMLIFGLITIRRSRNEVRAANIDLAATNRALEKALAAKTEFLATTSHEIRTPLNGILGMTQVMLADQALAPMMRDRISVVHSAGVTMRALVDDILDIAKMETGNMTLEHIPVDLPATLTEVSRLWEEQARAKGIAFHLKLGDCPKMIQGDAARLRQIVFNLLSNALKFTQKGSVTLRATTDGDRLCLSVSDTGIGIPADKQELIFESFRQVDAGTTRKFGGTGLGLAICRNLARAMDGDILVESEPGVGTTFTIELPLVLVTENASSKAAAGTGGLLIADRNPITRSMLKALFEPRAGQVEVAGSLTDALSALAQGQVVKLVVDDSILKAEPDPNAALHALAAAAKQGGAASAVLWANPDDDAKAMLANSGIDRIVSKPIAGATLVEMLYPASAGNRDNVALDLVSSAA